MQFVQQLKMLNVLLQTAPFILKTLIKFLKKDKKPCVSISYPDDISNDILSVVKSINRKNGIHRFIFHGKPGTGKTEACRHIARLCKRDLIIVNCEEIIDSHLGQTSKNIVSLFNEINKLLVESVIILFDEIDSLVLDRVNPQDLREMGRATSTFIKQLDELTDDVIIISTTNLISSIDSALERRLGAKISFDRYTPNDLIYIADKFIVECANDGFKFKMNSILLHKIIKNALIEINPDILKNIIKLAISFASDEQYDYLRRIFKALMPNYIINSTNNKIFTNKETAILTSLSESTISRKFSEVK